MKVLHLTAHLGGGVGKALSGLVAQANVSASGVQHLIVCLEEPEKSQFVERIGRCGPKVILCPSKAMLDKLIEGSDILQLEWWNHPVTIEYLCRLSNSPVRLLTWSHVSGLSNPKIPQQLILASHRFLFTSPCSLGGKDIIELVPKLGNLLGVVPSSGGFSELPQSQATANKSIAVGYIGSLNFSKLHPQYVDYLAAVEIPGFKVRMIGDATNRDVLDQQCESLGKAGMLEFRGYSPDIPSELGSINVLAYLLNPEHYGTTENALIESMAMGIVPIVLDNPCEQQIVEDHATGLIVHSPVEFAEAIRWLSNNPDQRQRLGTQASKSVRERFSAEKMEAKLNSHYRAILPMAKRKIVFSEIFGYDPVEWFLSCQDNRTIFADDGCINPGDGTPLSYGLYEKSKGTVFHFSKYFRDNLKLKSWANNLEKLQ